jgi:hypothetical protein
MTFRVGTNAKVYFRLEKAVYSSPGQSSIRNVTLGY